MGKSGISLSVLLLISVLWKPAFSNDKCEIACKGSPSTQAFLNGHKYSYGVEGTVTIFLTGADKQETSVKLLGQVAVTATGNCAHELNVLNLVISGPDGKKHPSPPGLEKPVRFSFQDGRVGAEICAEEGDTRRSLNIKRAIISLLQTEQKPSTQVDIFGTCPTEVSSSEEGNAVLVHRTRDLSRCGHREQGKNDLITGVYDPSAEIKSTQILQSSLNVESKVNQGVPEKVSASEEYLYKPFSVGQNGARARVHTKLTLTGTAKGAAGASHCTESRTIIFESPHGVTVSQNSYQSALAAVKDTAKTLANSAGPKSAGNFAQLVRILRTTNKDDLLKIFNSCKSSDLEKRVFLDGLLRAGTGYSIEASIHILKNSQLSSIERHLVFLSLGNARHVNNDALKAVASLLELAELPKEVYLGAGALAGVYCREHACHAAGGNEGIAALSQKLAAKLQNCKPKGKLEEDNVVAVLKGIHNIRHLEDSLVDKVVRCANDNSVKARVRVAALEAFSADPCSNKVHKAAIDILKNRNLDSEIRIKAYLAVIQCPCAHSASEIKNLLDTEPVHQVGRFITSSLRHIRASSSPDKRLARLHYGQIRTPNKFNIDDRKYSFYREVSYSVEALGAGGNLEQTVIYSQDSFLPRSVACNVTAELFGHSFNILEVGGRQGNLDRVAEHFFGPRNFFHREEPQKIYDNLVKRFQESKKRVDESLSRGRRSIKSEIDNFDKNLKAEAISYNNELDVDIYLKLFGTDAVFLSLGDDKGFDIDKALDEILKVANTGINQVKNFQQDVRAHLLFLDAELSYPTSTGLPLKLDLTGAATARLDVSTNIDIRQIIQSPQSAKIDIKLVPSTDIEISGLFLVDADSVSTGLKVITNLHSSTGGHIIAKVLENGRGFDLQFGLPVDKQEILTASNDLVYVTAEKGQKEKEIALKVDAERKDYAACFDQLSGVLGLTFCGEVSVPFSVSGNDAHASISKFLARYPLTGSSKVRIAIDKNDLRGYHIKGVYRTDGKKHNIELLFDAEGSKNRRTQVTGELALVPELYLVKIALDSPVKKLAGEIALQKNPTELFFLVKAQIDNTEYYGKAGFSMQGDERRLVYKPVLEYQMPGDKDKHNVKIDGQAIRQKEGPTVKYTIENIHLRLPNVKDPVEISGHVTLNEPPHDVIFKVVVKNKATLSGNIDRNTLVLEFQNTLNPYINFGLNVHTDNKRGQYHNDIELAYGGDLKQKNNRVIINQLLKNHRTDEDYNVITKNKFEICSIPLLLKLDADIDPKKVDFVVEGRYEANTAKFDLEARTKIKKPGDYSVKIEADVNADGVEVFAKRDIVSADKSNFENYLNIKNRGKYELSGVLLHKTRANDVNVGAIGHFKIIAGGKTEDIRFDVGVIENSNLYSSHAKIASTSAGELVDFLLKILRGANPSGTLKLVLKDAISANGQFKVTDSDGKGNGAIIVDFKKAQRKIKGDVKFQVKKPVYSGEFDIFLNFEKDNNDKLHFNTHTKNTGQQFETKNKLVYIGKKTELNVRQDGEFSDNGKSHSSVELVLPTERCLSFKVDRDVTNKDGVLNGHAEVFLSDAVKRGSAASTISYKGKVTNTNLDKSTLNYEGQLELRLKDGKQLQNVFYFKNNPAGDKFKFDFKTDVTGDVVPKPMSLLASGSYLESDSIIDDTYRLKGTYGDDIGFELAGVWEVKLLEKGDKKYLDDFTLTTRLPFEKAHDIKWVSTVLYLQPDGKDAAEYTIIESLQLNADVYKVDANGKVSPSEGAGVVKLLVPHNDPVTLNANYKNSVEGDRRQDFAEVKAKYGKGKSASVSVDSSVAPHDNSFVLKASSPQADKLKKLEVTVHSKNPAPDTYSSLVIVDADGRIYRLEDSVVLSKANPLVDIKYTSPSSPKPSRIYLKGSSLSSSQGKAELKVENIRDVSLEATSEANIQKDNVQFKFAANSDKLGFKNYQVEIASKDSGSGKRLEFQATNDNKNVLSGSTSFISKQEGQKTIVEGSGSVKVKEEQKSANFKYIRTVLAEHKEKGVETFFNIAIGERSYVAESRITNLEYKTSYVYCEEKKQCAHAELLSKIDVSKAGVVANLINAGFDLRKLGIAPEFGLQIKDEVSDKRPPQFELDVHVNKDDRKYHVHVYNTPDFGNAQSGIRIQLPQRVLALESTVSYPTNKQIPFPIKGEVSLDLDKNKQGHKTSGRFFVDINIDDVKRQTAAAEIGFNHPKINKEAVIKIGGVIARPSQNTVKIETLASICHPSLGADREAKLLFEANPTSVKLLIDTPLAKILEVDGGATVNEQLQEARLSLSLLQCSSLTLAGRVKDLQDYELTVGHVELNKPDNNVGLQVTGHIKPEQRIDFNLDFINGKDKKSIVHGALFLENDQVKSDYGISKDNYNNYQNYLKNELKNVESRVKHLGDKASKDFKTILKRVEPTYKNLEKAYAEDLQTFYKDISNDKTLKEISHALNDIVQYIAKLVEEVHKAIKPLVDDIVKTYTDFANKVHDMYEKQIEPQIEQIYATIAGALKEYLDAVIDVVAHFAALVTDFFEKHKPELKELTNTLTEIFKDLTRLLVVQLKEFKTLVSNTFAEVTRNIKQNPFFSSLNEKFQELHVPEQILEQLKVAYSSIRTLLPTPEIRDFADALNAYVQKKLRQQKCDDAQELRALSGKLGAAVTSLVQLVRAQLGQLAPPQAADFGSFLYPGGSGQSAPALGGRASLSLINQVLQGDIPDPLSLIRAYRPRSLNPLDEIPSKLRAVVVNGQHIFTFDGRHLTFPGTCRYVLAHDHVDRNFTLAIQLQNGQPKALVLEDKSGIIIELKDNGQVTLNGAAHGFPVIKEDVFAFRQPNGRIGLGSLYGLMAFCTSKLEVCYIEASGFYLGKLRGLLGDGNNEPYDDFRLPNGKICTSESEFGNAYRLARSCPQVQSPEHSHHQLHAALPPACEQVFGGSSPLRATSLLLDIAPFRQACVHACGGGAADGAAVQRACDLARGYAALALSGALPAALPAVCLRCSDADKPRELGDTYEIKLPNKQADLIVVVETTKVNEKLYKDMLVPLVSQVVDNLKTKHCSDIKVYLVGITSRFPYPILYDTDLKLKTAKVEFPDASRYQRAPHLETGNHYVDKVLTLAEVVNGLRIHLGLTNVVAGYNSLVELPLRAGAVKHSINLVGDRCVPQNFLVALSRAVAYSVAFDNSGYSHSLLTATPDLKLGSGKEPGQLVGFTRDSVILIGDKKITKESEQLRATLEVHEDGCIEFYESTEGFVFSSDNYQRLNPAQQKQYLQTAAGAITQKMFQENLVQECRCVYVDPFRVRSACFTKDRKEAARRRK